MQLPALHLTKAKVNTDLLRNYLYQALNDGFRFSFSLQSVLDDDQFKELSDSQVLSYIKKYVSDLPTYFYYFEDEECYQEGDTPRLYTNIISSSFDADGLLVLECYNSQIYDLRSFQGVYIDASCHDLDLSIEGQYMMRSSDDQPGFKVLAPDKIGSYHQVNFYADLDQFATDFLVIDGRDRIELMLGKGILKRIENFEIPKTKAEVKALLNANCNYPSSPLLRDFFNTDKELAIIAIQLEPLIFTLLSPELQTDHQVLTVLCLQTNCQLTPFFLTFGINPYTFLEEVQIVNLIIEQRLNFHAFSGCAEPSRVILEVAALHDATFLAYLSKFENISSDSKIKPANFDEVGLEIKAYDPIESKRNHLYFQDPQLMLLVSKTQDLILRSAPEVLLRDENWVEAVLVRNLNALQYSSPAIKKNAALLMRVVQNPATYQALRIYHAHEDSTLQRFSDLFLQPNFKMILLEQLPPQPLDDDLPF